MTPSTNAAHASSHFGGPIVQRDWSDDQVLKALQDIPAPIGTLVRAYPGKGVVGDAWLTAWLTDLARQIAAGHKPDVEKVTASSGGEELSLLKRKSVSVQTRLLSVRPHYFRGFREARPPIRLEEDLIVVDGRNSSGKTSLSEAIEWVLTGQLSRRAVGDQGHPSELADCIANEFRPDDERTWVELTIRADGDVLVLRRELVRDYTSVAAEQPESNLLVDGNSLTELEARDLYLRLFAGVHPILMQHTLRRFVHDDPASRRRYFETLLQLDEFTALIEKAVLGPASLKAIDNPGGGAGLVEMRSLVSEIERRNRPDELRFLAGLKKLEKSSSEDVAAKLRDCLLALARECLEDCAGAQDVANARQRLMEQQRSQREMRLPMLEGFARVNSAVLGNIAPSLAAFEEVMVAQRNREDAEAAASKVSELDREIAAVVARLTASGYLATTEGTQYCPLCLADPPSLTSARRRAIRESEPVTRLLKHAQEAQKQAKESARRELEALCRSASVRAPRLPLADDLAKQLEAVHISLVEPTRNAAASASLVVDRTADMRSVASELASLLETDSIPKERLTQNTELLSQAYDSLVMQTSQFLNDLHHLDEAVGAASQDDTDYRLRDRWLAVSNSITAIASDIRWERAKADAKGLLDKVRTGFIELRAKVIEDARKTFSDEMGAVWSLLRNDSGARFSSIEVPEPRGRGYKLEFELKAVISNGNSQPVVDALRVFSESQVNVVGIAAYITRARRVGHSILIFDDPVQSMDEEHFQSFAANLLPELIQEGFQVLVFTHSDAFARTIHHRHFLSESYATLRTNPSRRNGCYVEEGNRRVAERLNAAERLAQNGELENAWRLVRLAIERMYTLAYLFENKSFNPESWRNSTAEDMWEKGVAAIVAKKAQGKMDRLKEILSATAVGAHDKPATSETEVIRACGDLRKMLGPLQIGAG